MTTFQHAIDRHITTPPEDSPFRGPRPRQTPDLDNALAIHPDRLRQWTERIAADWQEHVVLAVIESLGGDTKERDKTMIAIGEAITSRVMDRVRNANAANAA